MTRWGQELIRKGCDPVAVDNANRTAKQAGQRWEIGGLEELTGGLCSLILAGVVDDREVVLKVPLQGTEEKDSVFASRAFSGHGGAEIIESDVSTGALLMPRLGATLLESGLGDEDMAAVCAETILRLRTAPMTTSISLERWFRELFEAPSEPLVDEAVRVARGLLDVAPEPTLLHGDLHHENLLRNGEGWAAIDPKGLFGDRAFEVATFIRNPITNPPNANMVSRRLQVFAKILGDPIERLWGWSFAFVVLDYAWSGCKSLKEKAFAETLLDLR